MASANYNDEIDEIENGDMIEADGETRNGGDVVGVENVNYDREKHREMFNKKLDELSACRNSKVINAVRYNLTMDLMVKLRNGQDTSDSKFKGTY